MKVSLVFDRQKLNDKVREDQARGLESRAIRKALHRSGELYPKANGGRYVVSEE